MLSPKKGLGVNVYFEIRHNLILLYTLNTERTTLLWNRRLWLSSNNHPSVLLINHHGWVLPSPLRMQSARRTWPVFHRCHCQGFTSSVFIWDACEHKRKFPPCSSKFAKSWASSTVPSLALIDCVPSIYLLCNLFERYAMTPANSVVLSSKWIRKQNMSCYSLIPHFMHGSVAGSLSLVAVPLRVFHGSFPWKSFVPRDHSLLPYAVHISYRFNAPGTHKLNDNHWAWVFNA